MSLILFWTDDATGLATTVRFDVVSQETHESLLDITEHPVEKGSDITDHARPKEPILNVEGYISNKPLQTNVNLSYAIGYQPMALSLVPLNIPKPPTPLPTPGALAQRIPSSIGDAAALLKGQPSSAALFMFQGDFQDRVVAIYNALKTAQLGRFFVTASTKLEQVDSMLIQRLAVPRTPQDGNGATFNLDLKRVRIVKSATVDAPVPAESRGQPTTNAGNKSAEADAKDAKNKVQLQSWAAGLFDGAAGAISNPFGGGP